MSEPDLIRQITLRYTRQISDLKPDLETTFRNLVRSHTQELLSYPPKYPHNLANTLRILENHLIDGTLNLVDNLTSKMLQILRDVLPNISINTQTNQISIDLDQENQIHRLETKLHQVLSKLKERRYYIRTLLISQYPEYKLLAIIEETPQTIKSLQKTTKYSSTKVRRIIRDLEKKDYIHIKLVKRRKNIHFLSAPWIDPEEL